ncbi:nuclear transport factor 2 family protein [bacterium]|nr:nuclear transport factor 2 family protein [bacterium]
MKTKLNISTVVLALSGFIAVQTATAQAPNPHPAHEALKGLQPFIGNWAGEFEAIGGFEGLAKGKMVTGTERVRWILNKTAVQMTWDNKFKDDGKSFNFGTGIITLDPVSKKLNWSSFGYDGKVYWTGKGVVELKATGLHFDIEENTINKTNTKYQSTRLKTNRKTMIVQHKNLVQNGEKIGDLKEIKMTRVPSNKKPTQSAVSAEEVKKITEEITQLTKEWSKVHITKDFDHLRRIWADDFSYTDNDGKVDKREDGFAFFEDNTDTFTSSGVVAFDLRVYGKNFAIGNGDHHEAGTDKDGKPFSRKVRFTNVWMRKNGKWQVVRGHSSPLE